MYEISVSEAKIKLSQLIESCTHGERIVITQRGVPMVELSPIHKKLPHKWGQNIGQIALGKNWNMPLDDMFEEYQ